MQSSRPFLFQVCLSLLLSTGSCTCKPLSDNDVQGKELEELHSQLSEEDLLEEEENEARVESLLGTMKEGFLRKLNLSDVPQEHSKIDPPQFMMELYDKYASDSSAIPQSDVIRSFTVQGTEIDLMTFIRFEIVYYDVTYTTFLMDPNYVAAIFELIGTSVFRSILGIFFFYFVGNIGGKLG